ncbi:MAG: extracellular solute-binding protein [Nitrospirales bacterium]|nr:extracellular solute-binding protein [Nitrospirales bacterium]
MKTALKRYRVLLLMLFFFGCQPASEESGTMPSPKPDSSLELSYFTWSDYVDQELLNGFEKKTGISIIVGTFSSNEELLAKVQSGVVGYDVIAPSDYMATLMARQGLLATLDLSRIPNVQHVIDSLKHLPFDPHNQFVIPYLWGTVGIGYDSTIIQTPPTSWEILWDPQYKGKISMLNDQREVFGVALRTMGYSLNATASALIEQAKQKLILQKSLVKAYTSESFDQMLIAGDVVLAHGWGGPIARAMREKPSIQYVVPQEGGTIWTDCLAVLQSSPHKELAMTFINYLLDVDVATATSNRLLFASANQMVKERVKAEVRENSAVYPSEATVQRMEWMTDPGEAIRDYDRAWTELKVH